jgi:hypothetical protein
LEGTTTYDVFADASWYGAPTDGYEATREAAMEGLRRAGGGAVKKAPDVPGLLVANQRRKP